MQRPAAKNLGSFLNWLWEAWEWINRTEAKKQKRKIRRGQAIRRTTVHGIRHAAREQLPLPAPWDCSSSLQSRLSSAFPSLAPCRWTDGASMEKLIHHFRPKGSVRTCGGLLLPSASGPGLSRICLPVLQRLSYSNESVLQSQGKMDSCTLVQVTWPDLGPISCVPSFSSPILPFNCCSKRLQACSMFVRCTLHGSLMILD
ncbi:hypothetical protein BDV06DRAFT_141701 [Aspergillus oleicola]